MFMWVKLKGAQAATSGGSCTNSGCAEAHLSIARELCLYSALLVLSTGNRSCIVFFQPKNDSRRLTYFPPYRIDQVNA